MSVPIHLSAIDGDRLGPACGAADWRVCEGHPDEVTCGQCMRTDAFKAKSPDPHASCKAQLAKNERVLSELEAADDNMGIYPAAVIGSKEGDYEQRDGYKNGWNACVMTYGRALREIRATGTFPEAHEHCREQLAKARPYMRHLIGCGNGLRVNQPLPEWRCTCGLAEFEKEIET